MNRRMRFGDESKMVMNGVGERDRVRDSVLMNGVGERDRVRDSVLMNGVGDSDEEAIVKK
ncbi:hypothetical protein L195_g060027 [Trifolium pratense]|uniref:Uncharacterized protein n=1 Tax=Trifolium pratense TaxID=57577 RepID=A0A2K3K1G1_TRIPR|nr:hypothetical protein L195_g060027 [Trifolium pratense]